MKLRYEYLLWLALVCHGEVHGELRIAKGSHIRNEETASSDESAVGRVRRSLQAQTIRKDDSTVYTPTIGPTLAPEVPIVATKMGSPAAPSIGPKVAPKTEPRLLTQDNIKYLIGSQEVTRFPIEIPFDQVQAPMTLPFAIHGSFRAESTSPDFAGIVDHEKDCNDHRICKGFKISLRPGGTLGFIVSQHTSYYNRASSAQVGLNDGRWHTFVCTATKDAIYVEVDGVLGTPAGTSDNRGVQTRKEFGRVIHTEPFVLGNDLGISNRVFQGALKEISITNLSEASSAEPSKDPSAMLSLRPSILPSVTNPNRATLIGSQEVTRFPIEIPFDQVRAPMTLPFAIHGSFRAESTLPDFAGIVDHEKDCNDHRICKGFKISLRPGGTLGFIVSQHTSYYNRASSAQVGLNDGRWHTFICTATKDAIFVEVDGVLGTLSGTSDNRGVQTRKEFGRVIHTEPFVLGNDLGISNRVFQGALKEISITNLSEAPSTQPSNDPGAMLSLLPSILPSRAPQARSEEPIAKPRTDPSAEPSAMPLPSTTDIDRATLIGSEAVSNFPMVIDFDQVKAPKKLPFQIHGSFRAKSSVPFFAAIVAHEKDCSFHKTCSGFKLYIHPGGSLGFQVSQHTSYHTSAYSQQSGLNDDLWHTFICTATRDSIFVEVDNILGAPVGPTDMFGVQEVKEFGRVIHSLPFFVGTDENPFHGVFTRSLFRGEVKNVTFTGYAE